MLFKSMLVLYLQVKKPFFQFIFLIPYAYKEEN